jgi:hypothetical protein
MLTDLDGKVWPTPPDEEERFKENPRRLREITSRYEKDVFVSEGHLQTRILGNITYAKPIPPGECGITSLAAAPDGRIFGATAGLKSHLFCYDPSPDADTVIDIGVIADNTAVCRSLAAHPDGRIFGGTAGDGRNGEGFIFCYTPVSDNIITTVADPLHVIGQIKRLAAPVKNEGMATLLMDKRGRNLYGLSNRSGVLFAYDIVADKVEIKGQIDELGEYSPCLASDNEGNIYGACQRGFLFEYNPESGKIEKLNIRIPCLKGSEVYNKVDSFAVDRRSGVIYGGNTDGVIFAFNPAAKEIIALGKPLASTRIRALTAGHDGKIYGLGGEPGGCAHLFCYNSRKHELKDLGALLAGVERRWYGYEFDAAVTGKNGEIYLGENDRISHLFIYYPPIENDVAT